MWCKRIRVVDWEGNGSDYSDSKLLLQLNGVFATSTCGVGGK